MGKALGVRHAALALVIGLAAIRPAPAQERPDAPDTLVQETVSGVGVSYWGFIPPAEDSSLAVLSNRRMPVWESILVYPYRVIAFPFRLLADGVGATVEFAAENPTLRRLFAFKPRAFVVTPDFGISTQSGTSVGVLFRHSALLAPGNELRLRLSTSTQGDQRLTLGLRFPVSAHGLLTIGGGLRDRANTRFFGVGPDAVATDESLFRTRSAWAGAAYRQTPLPNVSLEGTVLLSRISTDEPGGDFRPSIVDQFAGRLPSGFGTGTTGISAGVTLTHEDAPTTGRPAHGGIRRVRASHFWGTSDDETRFWSFRAEAQQFFRLWFPANVLALRAVVAWLEPVGDRDIPFQRLTTNDDPDLLRGYQDFRWRDRGLVAFSAEYRWPIWAFSSPDSHGLDFYLLGDIGQVFDEFDSMTDDLTVSYGAGIRVLISNDFVVRFEYARSDERGMWRLQAKQVFQFTRGLFHGRDPAPER